MAWAHLNVTEINVILIFFGLFMMTFMLTSKVTQSRLHLGAANVAFVAGIIFGPRAAGLLNPLQWSNVDTFILEATRVVLIAQCFANGVELPKFYITRNWRSLAVILGPAMVFGWLVSACCVKVMIPSLDWRQTLACAACFNAIDPILAATALQTGSFYRRVPINLRRLLRAEAGCNGITTTLVLDLAIYLLRYRHSARKVVSATFALGLAYDVALGVAFGVAIGFTSRKILWYFDGKRWVDRPAFLALYFSLALFCAGVGSIVGTDDVLLAFVAGYCLDYDDKYQEYTKEAKLSETIDLLLNLTYFVFIGSIVPWTSFNSAVLGISAWRLVVGTLLIFLFRRLPIITLLKPLTPQLKTIREAVFYAHFGPVGGGAIFAALLIRGQLTPGSVKSASETAANLDTQKFLDRLWAVTTFVVVCSSIVHGSSITLFAFGKKLNEFNFLVIENVYEPEEEEPPAKPKVPEIWLNAPSDEENSDRLASSSSARREKRVREQAIETILHDLEDGCHIIVEDSGGNRIKDYTIRRPGLVATDSNKLSLSKSPSDHSASISSENNSSNDEHASSKRRFRSSSTEQIKSYIRRNSGDLSKEYKGKTVVR